MAVVGEDKMNCVQCPTRPEIEKLKAWLLKKNSLKHFGQLEIDLEIEKLLNSAFYFSEEILNAVFVVFRH